MALVKGVLNVVSCAILVLLPDAPPVAALEPYQIYALPSEVVTAVGVPTSIIDNSKALIEYCNTEELLSFISK